MNNTLTRVLNKADGGQIKIHVGVPVQDAAGGGDWACLYRIEGLGHGDLRTSMGIDPIQAIFLAMIYVSTSLYCSAEYKRGEITWDGGMFDGDLGLPVSDSIRDVVNPAASEGRRAK